MNIEYGQVYFIKQLIAPISSCKFIPLHFLTMIRTAVHDMYRIDTNTSKNFIVINTGKGGSKSRSSNIKSNEIYDKVKELYGKDYNVVKYSTMLGKKSSIIHEALENTVTIFNRCKVYISTLGPALANIIFMNNGSHVIEVLSNEGKTYAQYAYLASAVGVSMVSVEGVATLHDAKTNLITTEINFDEILEKLSSALAH
jgi:DNA polymerase III alpha subunit